MLNEKDLQILELNNQINTLKAYVAGELSHLKATSEQQEGVVLAIARICGVSAKDLAEGLIDIRKNTDYKNEIQIIINSK